jgi:hypothetical protein
MSRTFQHRVDVHHLHSPSLVTVAINVDYIWPETRPEDKACARSDGWWGPHEYAILPQSYDRSSPYIAWIPSLSAYRHPDFARLTGLDPAIMLMDFVAFPLVPVPGHSTPGHIPSTVQPPLHPSLPTKPGVSDIKAPDLDFCSASHSMKQVVKTQVDNLLDDARKVIAEYENLNNGSIRLPVQALFNLKQAYYWNLLPGTNTECGHRLILAGMKRAAMELHGFILWYKDYQTPLSENPIPRKYPTWFRCRGALVTNEDDYAYLGERGIPAWMKIAFNRFDPLPSARAVSITTIPTSRDLMFPPSYKGGHHTAILFYPPEAEDASLFELSARGYAGRRDVYQFHSGIARVHEKMRNEQCTFTLNMVSDVLMPTWL